eukprot:TRINITY_DN3586_c1_g1_i1.p1 TRINITY_DN3586_c1_g1~~TRINITY_DN3586_c1_g1_i1.p1  ORF type:complete len:277 (-),score=12.21 TRINITY_DN3586_c1_g1_i1:256-1086(-)
MPFYGERDLFWKVVEDGPLTSSRARCVTRDVLRALQHIHALEILHCDVKPANVMIAKDGRGVLVDFDQACWCFDDRFETMTENLTPGYTAPEVILGQSYSAASDIFSAGCVLYFMLLQTHPFVGGSPHPKAIFRRTVTCHVRCNLRSDRVSSECKSLILSLVAREPHKRLSTGDALRQDWFEEECKRTMISSIGHKNGDVLPWLDSVSHKSSARPAPRLFVPEAAERRNTSLSGVTARAVSAGFSHLRSRFRRGRRSTSEVRSSDVGFVPLILPHS